MTSPGFSIVLDLRNRSRTYEFLDCYYNPGIGGSEAYLVHLAMRLFDAGMDICLVILGGGNIQVPSKIPIIRFESWRKTETVILNSGVLEEILLTGVSIPRLIVVSHHPFDMHLKILKRGFRSSIVEIVNLGKFQHESNQFVKLPSSRIPGFWPRIERVVHLPVSPPIIGHIGSLHPSKGFSDVLKILKKLPKESFDKLEVVGGSSLYGGEAGRLFDSKSRHGRKINRLLIHDRLLGKVEFLGIVPEPNEFSKRWSAVLLNPKGIGEADSQTLKELHARRVPVFASLHFGLGDFTRVHREYGLSGWRISRDARNLSGFLQDPHRWAHYQMVIEKRLFEVKELNDLVTTTWINTISVPPKAGKRTTEPYFAADSNPGVLQLMQLAIGRLLFTSLWIVDRIRKAG